MILDQSIFLLDKINKAIIIKIKNKFLSKGLPSSTPAADSDSTEYPRFNHAETLRECKIIIQINGTKSACETAGFFFESITKRNTMNAKHRKRLINRMVVVYIELVRIYLVR